MIIDYKSRSPPPAPISDIFADSPKCPFSTDHAGISFLVVVTYFFVVAIESGVNFLVELIESGF